MSRPFFSVVLPTLGQCEYLSQAIQSVLAQTCSDFELVISNNSGSDAILDLLSNFDDRRIRYITTGRTLPIGDSYEFATNQCRGEFVTYLGDDDAFSPLFLERLEHVVQIKGCQLVSCRLSEYYYDDTVLNGRRIPANTLSVPDFDNRLLEYDSKDVLQFLFSEAGLCKKPDISPVGVPQLLNTVYHRSIVEKLQKRLGQFIPKLIFGDIFSAVTTLCIVSDFYLINAPLAIHGFSKGSLTSISSTAKLKEFVERNRELLEIKEAPLKIYTPVNQYADVLLQARSVMYEELEFLKLDWDDYFAYCLNDLLGLKLDGYDTSGDIRTFWKVLADFDPDLKGILWAQTHGTRGQVRHMLRGLLRSMRIHPLIRKTLRPKQMKYLRGELNGFGTIGECANAMNGSFLSAHTSGALRI